MSVRKIVPIEQAVWGVGEAPGWVVQREVDWEFRPEEGHAVAFLLSDEQHSVATKAVSYRSVRALLTHAAVQALGQVHIDFDPAAHRLTIHEVAVWRRNLEWKWEKRSHARREDFLLREREEQLEQQMLHGRVSVVALLEDVRVGDAIEIAYTLEPLDPLPGLKFGAYFSWAWSLPMARVFFTVHREGAETPGWRLYQPDGAPSPVEEVTPERVTWRIENPAIAPPPEPNAPGTDWQYTMLEVSGWESWSEVANFVTALWVDALADGREAIAAEVARLRVEGDAAATARAIIRFAQEQIRYLAVDFGHGGGILPNGAGLVLRRRFGDCKDKSVLLAALLRAAGVEAWPMLVSPIWRSAVRRVKPSTLAFSHAIVVFLHEGVRRFVNPTVVGQGGDVERMVAPPYGCGLELREGTNDLRELPSLPPAELELTEIFHLGDGKEEEGSVETILRGSSWMADKLRAALLQQGQAGFCKARAKALEERFPAIEAKEESQRVEDRAAENMIELRAAYRLPTWGEKDAPPPAMFGYGAHGLFLAIENLDGPRVRRQPWVLPHPMRVRHVIFVRGKKVQKPRAETFRLSGPGFQYSVDVTSQRREVTFDCRWETTKAEIPADEWVEYCTQRLKAQGRMGASVRTGPLLQRNQLIGVGVIVGLVILAVIAGVTAHRNPLLKMQRDVRANPQKYERQVAEALDLARKGESERASQLMDEVAPVYDKAFHFQVSRAEAAMLSGRMASAREAIEIARKLQPESAAPIALEALFQQLSGELPQAWATIEKARAIAPEELPVLFRYAHIARRIGERQKALGALEKLLARAGGNPEALQEYAFTSWELGERERADEAILKVRRAQPTPSLKLESVTAEYFAVTGRHAEALEPARKATEMAPDNLRLQLAYNNSLVRAGRIDEAVAQARKLTEDFSKSPMAWQALATAAATARETATAEGAFQEWMRLTPGNGNTKANYGFFLHQTGRNAEALGMLEQATREAPNDGYAWMNYGVVLEALGRREEAAAARKKADAILSPEQRAKMMR